MASLPPNRVTYSPIIDRPRIIWPNGARIALWIMPNVEFYEYLPDFNGVSDPYPRTPYPDVQQYSYRDYGNRVGFWRLLEVLDKHNITCTAALNMAVLEHLPEVSKAMVQRNWDFVSHGIYNTRYIHTYSEEQERNYYQDCIQTLYRHTGKRLRGVLGLQFVTERTPDLLAEAGLIYQVDWMHDDQPVPIKVRSGRLVSVPFSVELDDAPNLRAYNYEADYFVRICKAQFDQLYREGSQSGRVMCVSLHPFVSGQPHRVKHVDELLTYVLSHERVWQATADEIADYYMANCYDQAVEHADRLNARYNN